MTALLHPPSDAATDLECLRREVSRLTDEVARLRLEKAALEAACHEDSLTGLLNRRGFGRDLTRALAYTKRYGTPAALLLLDLDRFKPINDLHGHETGDLALRHVAECLRRNLRASDSLGRIGGDEFAILLWQVDEPVARAKADALEAILDATPFAGGAGCPVGGSIGVSPLLAVDDVPAALARADRAMYRRKAERRRARPDLAPTR
jgi:diguanylate cyclase (GGDEF)-like protein